MPKFYFSHTWLDLFTQPYVGSCKLFGLVKKFNWLITSVSALFVKKGKWEQAEVEAEVEYTQWVYRATYFEAEPEELQTMTTAQEVTPTTAATPI